MFGIVLWILLVVYFLFSPIIFFIISNQKVDSLKDKVENLENEISRLKKSGQSSDFDTSSEEAYKETSQELNLASESLDKNTYSENISALQADSYDELDFSDEKIIKAEESLEEDFTKEEASKKVISSKKAESKFGKNIVNKAKKNISAESIIAKLGALLLIVGFGFVYKLAYDNGYIGQDATIVLGFVISILVLALGIYFIKKDRIILSQVLIGTSFAISYLTTYAGYLYYGNLSSFNTLLILILVSLVVFGISYIYSFQTVVVIANIMSVTVPFIVDMQFLGVVGFGLYLISLSLISMIIYYIKKWHFLQISNVIINMGALIFIVLMKFDYIDFKLLSYLVIAQSLVLLLPDIIRYIHKGNKELFDDVKNNIKSSIIQVSVFALTFILIYLIGELDKDLVAYIMFAYSFIYGLATYLSLKKTDFAIFIKFLYLLSSISLISALAIRFNDLHLGLFILAVSVLLFVFDKFVKTKLTFVFGLSVYLISLLMIIADLFDEDIKGAITTLAIALILLFIADKYFREEHKNLFRFASYQIFVSIFVNIAIYVIAPDLVDDLNPVFTYLLAANTALFIIYELIRYKFDVFKEKKSLFTFIGFVGINSIILIFYNIVEVAELRYAYEIVKYLKIYDLIISLLVVLIVILFAKKSSNQKNAYLYKILILIISETFAIVQISRYFSEFRYGILLSVLIVLIFELYIKKYNKNVNKLKDLLLLKIIKIVSISFNLMLFIYVYPEFYNIEKFSFISLILNSLIMGLAFYNMNVFDLNKYIRYGVSTSMIIYLSYYHIYVPTQGNHYLSLALAMYVIIMFVYYLRKSDTKMANICIASLVFIVAKFVIVDLKTAALISKVITSIVFGVVLICLSYLIPKLVVSEDVKKEK